MHVARGPPIPAFPQPHTGIRPRTMSAPRRPAPQDDRSDDGGDDLHDPSRPSKSQRKRDMTALQELGERLVELSPEQLDSLPLEEFLRDAVDEARRITAHEGRRRQMQYVGRLMREVDPEPIRRALALFDGRSREHAMLEKLIERWRVRLMAEDGAIAALEADYPDRDWTTLRGLVAEARAEVARGRTPRRHREIFRELRRRIATPVAAPAAPDAGED